MMIRRFSFFISNNNFIIPCEVVGSSDAVSSSASINGGFLRMIFAKATRYASPPDNSYIFCSR